MTQISRMYGQVALLAAVPVLLFLGVQLWRFRQERHGRGDLPALVRLTAELIAVGNMLGVAVLTLTPGHGEPRSLNLVPLLEVYRVWLDRGFYSAPLNELYINFSLFVPFGIAARFAWSKVRTFRRTVGIVAVVSFVIEMLQFGLGLGRVASVTDILLPVAGAALAWVVVDLSVQFWSTHPANEFGVTTRVR